MTNYAKTPTVYQMEFTECGAASLAMIFAYYGKFLPLEKMRIETGVSRDGSSAANLMRAAKRYGLDCRAFRREPEDLRLLPMPCIIHWNFCHFVVLEGFKGNNVYINDPAVGRRKLTMQDIDDCFTGVVLTFEPTAAFEPGRRPHTLKTFIANRLSGQGDSAAKIVAIGLLLVFPGILLPVLTQYFTDEVLMKQNTSVFGGVITLIAAASILQALLSVYRGRILVRLQRKMVLLSAREFIDHLFRLPIAFFDQRNAGDLGGRVGNNASVSDFLAGGFAETVLNIIVAVFYLVVLFLYSWVLTLIALIATAANIIVIRISSGMLSSLSVKQEQDAGKLAGTVCSGLSITDTLKAAGVENEYVGRILGYTARTITTEQRLNRTQQIINAIPSAIGMIVDMLIIVVGGCLIINGNKIFGLSAGAGGFTVGKLIAFTALYGSFSAPVSSITGLVKNLQTTKADINRVEDIMKYEEDYKFAYEQADGRVSKLIGSVEFRNVSFGYSALAPAIINDLSFRIPCGSSVAFIGSSGSGKSTVSKILSGLYSPWAGEVLLDGKDASALPNEKLNVSVSTVSQNITLFSGTIRDNLTMWNPHITDADLVQAAKDACIHDVISSKPGAYDYRLTEGAGNLSGGQRQRLEIARALVTNPTVLIMDEATSALDPVTEKKILDNIRRRGCTCFIVAHRLSAIRDCDNIFVMKDGAVIQSGSHAELAVVPGPYRAFIQNN